ncbi:unnamed protein product [Cochlearia groenlandica]
MNMSEYFAAGDNLSDQQTRQLPIHGPRPSPLSVHKDSHKIRKPPKHPAPPPYRDQPPPQPPYAPREPVVIYAVSPKIIHTTTSNFMNVVQRLTGISSNIFLESHGGDVSPAARLASTENASPRGGRQEPTVETSTAMEEAAAEFGGYTPGILSPSPAMLLTTSAGIFSPTIPPGLFSPAGLMSPFIMYSPPGFTNLASSPTFADLYSQIWSP